MIATHCRHTAYPEPGPSKFPERCKIGVDLGSFGCGILNRPCYKGKDSPATCPYWQPWTKEEIAADEAESLALLNAVAVGTCTCGAVLVERGPWLVCPAKKTKDDDHVVARVTRRGHDHE